jgi:ATP-binding cassette subfamily B protein
VLAYWRDAPGTTILVIAITLLGAAAAIVAPYLFSRAINILAYGGQGPNSALKMLLFYALLCSIATGLRQTSRFLIVLCAERLVLITNTTFFSRLLQARPGS